MSFTCGCFVGELIASKQPASPVTSLEAMCGSLHMHILHMRPASQYFDYKHSIEHMFYTTFINLLNDLIARLMLCIVLAS